jgi:hypothetical protein
MKGMRINKREDKEKDQVVELENISERLINH